MALFSKKTEPQDTKPKKYTAKELEAMKWKKVKVPTVFQMEAVECGAAALAMVMAYYGKFVSLAELRTECGVSRDGSKASNMVKAARRYGFIAKGFKKEEINQLKPLHFPLIIFWNFNHFIVLEGVKGNKFFVNDPATGPRSMEREDFDMGFSGVVLDFEPGPDFKKSGRKPSILPGLVRRLSHSKLALSYVLFLNLFMIVPGLIIPACTRIFIDSYLIKRMDSWVKPLLLAMLLVTVIQTIMSWLQAHYYLKFETKLAVVHSTKFFWHIFRLPVEFFNQRFAGDVAARVSINDTVADLLAGQLAGNFVSFLLVIFYAVIMYNYDWLLTLLCFISSGFQIGYMKYVSKQMIDKNLRMEQEGGKLAGISMGGLVCIETLKASGAESDFFSKWSGYFTKVANSGHEMSLFTTRLGILPKIVNNFLSMAILGVGGMRVMDGHLTMGMLVAFQTLMGSFTGPVMGLVGLGTQIQQLQGSMSRLDDVLNNEIDPIYTSGPDADNLQKDKNTGDTSDSENSSDSEQSLAKNNHSGLPTPIDINDYLSIEKQKDSIFSNVRICKLTGEIELRNVTFGYSRMAQPLIKDFNLTIKPGQRVAFVGPSGCGKSTISKLICGLYQPWSGQILFDGKARDQITRKVMTNSLAMVNQEILLFEGSIKDNLTLWDSTIDQKKIIRAAKDAVIHDDISMRPGSYDSKVVEGGFNFSGGQRQRVEIARALVTSPTILVLDEATSALDPYTEELIDINLRRRGCTCVIVAHRLSTIRDADEIIVMHNGLAVQRGTHDQMKDIDGPYARLIAHE